MQNLFMPSETVACIEQKYVGKTYKVQGKVYSEPFTKEKIKSLFDVYVTALDQVFGGRAIVMQRTRATKGGFVVPVTSYEYVYKNKSSISSYVEEGYYAVTINGYRVSDIIDSGLHMFYDSVKGAKNIIENIANVLDLSKCEARCVLSKFFFNSGMQNFDAFLTAIANTGKMDVYNFDVCASFLCSFGEPLPVIRNSTEIQVMSRRAQDLGLAVDEVDLDGWKDEKTKDVENRRKEFDDFFDRVYCENEMDEKEDESYEKNDEKYIKHDPDCASGCDYKWEVSDPCKIKYDDNIPPVKFPYEETENEQDKLDEIRKDVDDLKKKAEKTEEKKARTEPCAPEKGSVVGGSVASDGNSYTYSITTIGDDGKPHTVTYTGDEAKKMIEANNDGSDSKMDKRINRLDDMFARLEKRLSDFENRFPATKSEPPRRNNLFNREDPFEGFKLWDNLFGGF